MSYGRHRPTHFTLTNQTGVSAGASDTADAVYVGELTELLIVLSVTAITGGSVTVFIDAGVDGLANGDDGVSSNLPTKWTNIASFAAQSAVTVAGDIVGPNLSLGRVNNQPSFGDWIRVRWTQTATSATFSVKCVGK